MLFYGYSNIFLLTALSFWHNADQDEWEQDSKRSGTKGKCIEARELVVALPETFTQYEPQELLERFTDEFRKRYGVECVSALHHNKRKTNYHIHLISAKGHYFPKLTSRLPAEAYSMTKQVKGFASRKARFTKVICFR